MEIVDFVTRKNGLDAKLNGCFVFFQKPTLNIFQPISTTIYCSLTVLINWFIYTRILKNPIISNFASDDTAIITLEESQKIPSFNQ